MSIYVLLRLTSAIALIHLCDCDGEGRGTALLTSSHSQLIHLHACRQAYV